MTAIARGTFLTLTLSLAVASGVMAQRPRPPAAVKCSRDHLTAFQGRILEYTRSRQEVSLRVRTDEATTESLKLYHTDEHLPKMVSLDGVIMAAPAAPLPSNALDLKLRK